MWEKLIISLATSLVSKLVSWLLKKHDESVARGRENDRISTAVDNLINAKTKDDIRTSFDNLP